METATMDIMLNGKQCTVPPCTVLELLSARELKPQTVVVEVNREIVPAQSFADRHLAAGDNVEILYFVGGG